MRWIPWRHRPGSAAAAAAEASGAREPASAAPDDATAGKIASVQVRQPEASVLALAHPASRVDTVVDLLAGGATACVRAGDPALVAAHPVACARRYAVPVG